MTFQKPHLENEYFDLVVLLTSKPQKFLKNRWRVLSSSRESAFTCNKLVLRVSQTIYSLLQSIQQE